MNSVADGSGYFLYGTLKPGQIAHYLIEDFVDADKTVDAVLPDHYLAIRDGLPFAYPFDLENPDGKELMPLSGFLVYPKDGEASKLDEIINEYEGSKLYKRELGVVITSGGERVGASFYAVKKARNRTAREVFDGNWRITDDPILGYGLPMLVEEIKKLNLENAQKWPANMPDEYWPLMWKVQGMYANLNSVLERFCRFYFGSNASIEKGPEGMDKLWRTNPKRLSLELPEVQVHSAKEASKSKIFRSAEQPFSTWYQVRNNMVHAGKDGYEDLETIIGATVGMMKVLPETILLVVPEFKEKWGTLKK
jgi:hypothetical protein